MRFFMEFLKLTEGGGVDIFLNAKIMHFALHFYMQKTMHVASRFNIQKSGQFALHFYKQENALCLGRCKL